MNSEDRKSEYASPNKQRPFTPIRSPTPKNITLQQYNSFSRSPQGTYENLFNELGVHELKRTGLDPEPQFLPPSGQISCNCKKTACLKLYCPCFANGQACNENCRCEDCKNKDDNLNRQSKQQQQPIVCNCKKTSCLKKYCYCFLNGRKCGKECKCEGCENKEVDDKHSPEQINQIHKIQAISPPRLKKKVRIENEREQIVIRRSSRNESKTKGSPQAWQATEKTTSKKKEHPQNFTEQDEDQNEGILAKKSESGKKTANQKQLQVIKRQLIKK
eukprot:TRINITY_DN40936_c0_g1_i1.p2 TRINITY_DN40936_c0_g1~~TRINITY_DN40936_c0_g1_i1.p2  ORF type:complete len:274 (-),score=35.10 TRINITY_DN40936_c0_g1_i1:70-891(-)